MHLTLSRIPKSWNLLAGAGALFIFAAFAGTAHAAGGGSSDWSAPAAAPTTDFGRAQVQIAAENYEAALSLLEKAKTADPDEADIHNLIGYASRKLGRYDQAYAAYETALQLDPGHKGALEYQGELFLTLGRLDAAKANLARLDDLCWFSCEEERELERAIADYEAKSS